MKSTIKSLLVFACLLVIPAIHASKLPISRTEQEYQAVVANLNQVQEQVISARRVGIKRTRLNDASKAENAALRARIEALEKEKSALQKQKPLKYYPSLTNFFFLNKIAQEQKAQQQREAVSVQPTNTMSREKTKQPVNPGFFTRLKNNWYQLFSSPR